MKLDLHLHAKERSNCAVSSEKEQIEAAIAFGLSGIAFTDHNKLVPTANMERLKSEYAPFRLFSGIEINTADAGEDVLVLGLNHEDLQNKTWYYEELYMFVRKEGGFLALAHPYRYTDKIVVDINRLIPDAIEIHSMNIGRCDEERIQALANRLGTKTIASSDAHYRDHVGIYHIDLQSDARDNQELAEALRSGVYAIAADQARIQAINKVVREREEVIRRFIQEEKAAEDYSRETQNWEGFYNRVAMGKSYEI